MQNGTLPNDERTIAVMNETEPPWLEYAKSLVGIREIAGLKTNPIIARWLIRLHAWWDNDETPWCGVYVAEVFLESGYKRPLLWMRAKAWEKWGYRLVAPRIGCVAVLTRPLPNDRVGYHVGFFMGYSDSGRVRILGGNQGNQVSISEYAPTRVYCYRWPK